MLLVWHLRWKTRNAHTTRFGVVGWRAAVENMKHAQDTRVLVLWIMFLQKYVRLFYFSFALGVNGKI